MESVKDAVAQAIEYARNLLGDRAQAVQLEEVESGKTSTGDVWLITLSMLKQGGLAALTGEREYKTFTVSKDTGEVISMKIRELSKN